MNNQQQMGFPVGRSGKVTMWKINKIMAAIGEFLLESYAKAKPAVSKRHVVTFLSIVLVCIVCSRYVLNLGYAWMVMLSIACVLVSLEWKQPDVVSPEKPWPGRSRTFYLLVSFVEVIGIWLLLGWVADYLIGGGKNAYIIILMIWSILLGTTSLVNLFFISIPKNSGAVIENRFLTYERLSEDKLTELQPTKALREVGPGIHGILLWEKIGWIIDLGKQIQLPMKITTYTKDNGETLVEGQLILTPLQGWLVNLVRHDADTIRKYFEGSFKAETISIVSNEYSQSIPAKPGQSVIVSIFEKVSNLKEQFKNFFGGPDKIDKMEKQFGTFTNCPQLISITRTAAFQKSVESLQIAKNTNEAVKTFTNKETGSGLDPNQALIAAFAAQEITNENLVDVKVRITGLENAQHVSFGAGVFPGGGKPFGKSKKKGEKSDE